MIVDRHAERLLRARAAGSSISASTYTPDRAPIKPLQALLPALRDAGVPIIWVNWGNRPDLANMPPNQIHLYKPDGTGIGLGDPLPGNGAHAAARRTAGPPPWSTNWSRSPATSRSTSTASAASGTRRSTASCAISACARVLFAGVNTDQCVLHSLTDANFLGYGCVLVEDCCATTSPDFCTEAIAVERQEMLRLRGPIGKHRHRCRQGGGG